MKKISYFIVFIILITLTQCAVTKNQMSTDYSFINGDWIQPCDSLIAGDYKGEVECDIDDAKGPITTFDVSGNKGKMVITYGIDKKVFDLELYQEGDNKFYMNKVLNGNGEVIKIYKMDSLDLQLFNQKMTSIKLYERK